MNLGKATVFRPLSLSFSLCSSLCLSVCLSLMGLRGHMHLVRMKYYDTIISRIPAAAVCSVAQSCLTLCGPMDCSPPGSSFHGSFQARIGSGMSFPTPGDPFNPGTEPASLASQAWQASSLQLSRLGSPRWVTVLFHVLPLYFSLQFNHSKLVNFLE